MPSRVCGACGGDDPDCLVCRGSGVDPPPSKAIADMAVTRKTVADNEMTAEKIVEGAITTDPPKDESPSVHEMVGMLEERVDAHRELMDQKVDLLILNIRQWLYKVLMWLTPVLAVSVVGAFLMAHHGIGALPGAAMLVVLVVIGCFLAILGVLSITVSNALRIDEDDD